MEHNHIKNLLLTILFSLVTPCFATNFDDGISAGGPIDDKIQKEPNREFITQKAIARSRSGRNKVISNSNDNAGIGNIIIGPGANLNGAIILNQSENVDAAVISD